MSGERLAIDGGAPVRASLLPYARQDISDDDVAAVAAALRSDWLTTGPRVPAFEEALAAATGARHAVAFSSGTAGLHGAMASLGLAPGAEVLTTPMTFAATANAVLYVGAEPRFADIDPGSLLLDPGAVEAALTPATRALAAVDYAGQPADYATLRAIADAAPAVRSRSSPTPPIRSARRVPGGPSGPSPISPSFPSTQPRSSPPARAGRS